VKNVVFEKLPSLVIVTTDVLEEHISTIIKVTRIGELGTTLAATSNSSTHMVFIRWGLRLLVAANVVPSSPSLVTLEMKAPNSSETSVLKRATRCNITEYGILHNHRRENLKSYTV
jgi:hypothetical protein